MIQGAFRWYNPGVMNIGFLGMPGSGKSTIFHALTHQAISPQFLGYDLKPHHAVVKIPDPRLDKVEELFAARNKVYATIDFIDIPGFDPKSTEKKLKNSVLEHYRKCDALAFVRKRAGGLGRWSEQIRSWLLARSVAGPLEYGSGGLLYAGVR